MKYLLKKKRFLLDIKSLLYEANLLHVDEDCKKELLSLRKLQDVLLKIGTVCSIDTVYIRVEDSEEKRQCYKIVCVIEEKNLKYPQSLRQNH